MHHTHTHTEDLQTTSPYTHNQEQRQQRDIAGYTQSTYKAVTSSSYMNHGSNVYNSLPWSINNINNGSPVQSYIMHKESIHHWRQRMVTQKMAVCSNHIINVRQSDRQTHHRTTHTRFQLSVNPLMMLLPADRSCCGCLWSKSSKSYSRCISLKPLFQR